MTAPLDTQVIIVGGGPVGMLLASEVSLLGGHVVVIERRNGPTDEPRAGTMHARTLQCMARRGFASANAENDPQAFQSREYFFAGVPGLTMRSPGTEPPPVLNIPQIELERMFEKRARDNGAIILRCHEALEAAEGADGVVVSIREVGSNSPASLSVRGEYLVGADGARSLVRDRIGFETESHPATLDGLIARARLLEPSTAPLGFQKTSRGWTRIDQLGEDGYARLMTFGFEGPAPDRHAPVDFEEFQRRFERIVGSGVPMTDPRFLARHSDYARMVLQYKLGRVLLAGDAAHHHFPIAGQGLNLGIQDAFNLGWKLAAVIAGAPEALLDTYHDERHRIARRVVMNTRAQVVLMRPTTDIDPLRELLAELIDLAPVAERLAQMINGQDISYPQQESTCSGDFQVNLPLETGDGPTSLARLLEVGRAVLIAPETPHAAEFARRWNTKLSVAQARADVLPWEAALIRPDGYLAWHGSLSGSHDLERVLESWFGSPVAEATARRRAGHLQHAS